MQNCSEPPNLLHRPIFPAVLGISYLFDKMSGFSPRQGGIVTGKGDQESREWAKTAGLSLECQDRRWCHMKIGQSPALSWISLDSFEKCRVQLVRAKKVEFWLAECWNMHGSVKTKLTFWPMTSKALVRLSIQLQRGQVVCFTIWTLLFAIDRNCRWHDIIAWYLLRFLYPAMVVAAWGSAPFHWYLFALIWLLQRTATM